MECINTVCYFFYSPGYDPIVSVSRKENDLARGRERHFRTGKRTDSQDMTLFRLPVLALLFSPTSSGRHYAGFPVAIKTPRICVDFTLINEIMLFVII